jgi:ATP-dependent DNA helicase RecQ
VIRASSAAAAASMIRPVVQLSRAEIRVRAREVLGHRTLLPGQADAVASVVEGNDTLALLPTGGGKSAIYQLAGLERPGATLVVSPLLALQQDQLATLAELGLAGDALNSTRSESERESALGAFEAGETEFLLLAPEQLASAGVVERVARARPSLLVVDEAHCVSEWGHDFRPEYRRLGAVRRALGSPPVLALTATASPPVRADIARWLDLAAPRIVARGFDRPELLLSVATFADARHKMSTLREWVTGHETPGIVYMATRGGAEEVATALADSGRSVAAYHAGLGKRQRADVLDGFMDGSISVVVATVAFGMGVDKPNVRFVAHGDPSDSLEAYHQEIGRAGRDGNDADVRLFFDPADLGLLRFQSIPPALTVDDGRRVLKVLRRGPSSIAYLARATRRSQRRITQVVARLEELEAVVVEPTGLVALSDAATEVAEDGDLASAVVDEQESRRHHARSRVELLRGYADTRGCRRRFLLNVLGEEYEPPCDRCDNCRAGMVDVTADVSAAPFKLNDAVVHTHFGRGEVTRVERDLVGVRFESVGYKTLALPDAIESGALKRRNGRGQN